MQITKRRLFFLFTLGVLTIGNMASAAPARPKVVTLQQPDGTPFEAKRWGDEGGHGWETSHGYTVVRSDESGWWFYAVKDSTGTLIATVGAAGIDVPPPESFHARPPGGERSGKELATHGLAAPREVSDILASEAAPVVREGKMPVILATFADRAATFSRARFDGLLFGNGTGSMADFYREVSYGAFTLSGDVLGWVTVSGDHRDYGANRNGYDVGAGRFVYDALTAFAAENPDFDYAKYDLNKDCVVDVIGVIHQGEGEDASHNDDDIWSQSWKLSSSEKGTSFNTHQQCPWNTQKEITINDYILMPEMLDGDISTIGVFAHEYGHALKLPDLYDTDSTESEGVGRWSLMASGSWNGVDGFGNTAYGKGNSPAHLDPWCKYKLGWVAPTPVEGSSNDCTVVAAATANPDPAKLVYRLGNGSAGTGEYFLVENRFKTGFDAGLPGQGLLIWHIDAGVRTNDRECWPGGKFPCTEDRHYKVALMQADNRWDLEKGVNRGDSGDPFPGVFGAKNYFGWASEPSSRLYNHESSGVAVRNISSPALTMTATLDKGEACNYFVTPTAVSFGPGGGSGLLKVLSPPGCPEPEVSSSTDWIIDRTVSSTTVRFKVEPNGTGAEKTGAIAIGNQTVNVSVAGNSGPLNLQLNGVASRTVLKSQILSGTVRRGSTVTVVADAGTYAATVDGTDWWVPIDLLGGTNSFAVTASDGTSLDDTKTGTIEVEQFTAGSHGVVAEKMPGGTVAPSGMSEVANGGRITYSIKAAPGYSLVNVSTAHSDGIYASAGKHSRLTFKKVTDNRGILAKFKRKTYRISAKAGTGGLVSAVQDSVKYGDDAAVTFTPMPGYLLSRVVIDGTTVCGTFRSCESADASYVFKAVDRHHSIKGYFERE